MFFDVVAQRESAGMMKTNFEIAAEEERLTKSVGPEIGNCLAGEVETPTQRSLRLPRPIVYTSC